VRAVDFIWLALGTLRAYRLRSALSAGGIAVGIASVMLLTSIGEGTRQFVLSEFTQFGTNLLSINPGRTETVGFSPGLVATTRKLTIDDAQAVERLPGIEAVTPVVLGVGRVARENRARDVYVYGATHDALRTWQMEVRQGQYLPPGDPRRGSPVVVLGPKLKHELFGEEQAVGARVRIAGTSFRVIGVLASKGQFLGFDLDDSCYVPVATAMRMFNRDDLISIDVAFSSFYRSASVAAAIRRMLMERHDGEEDFTITTQDAMLEVLDRVLGVVTVAVGAIGGISLLVGAIGILTMMWISVNQRISEIGLMRALGARRFQVLALFLFEACLLSTVGGAVGVGAGAGFGWVLRVFLPGLPVRTPPEYVAGALALSFTVGLLASVLPARRAASFDPIEALRAE
jgi:putative ABC transport system permease protein